MGNRLINVPIGVAINRGIKLYLSYRRDFLNWCRRARVRNPTLANVTLAFFALQLLQGQIVTWEECYAQVRLCRERINRLQVIIVVSLIAATAVAYIYLLIVVFLSIICVRFFFFLGGFILGAAAALLSFLALLSGLYFLNRKMQWVRFAPLCLLQFPQYSLMEVIKHCDRLLQNSNVLIFSSAVGFLVNYLLGLVLLVVGVIVNLFQIFLPNYWAWCLPLLCPVVISLLTEVSLLSNLLDTCYYYQLGCWQEGWDLNLGAKMMEVERKVKFLTPESVELEFTLAGIGNRALALAIDYLILFFVLFCLFFVWLAVAASLADYELEQWFNAFMSLLSFSIYTGYFIFWETTWSGQTPGKRFTKIRVVKTDGRPVGLSQSLLRALLRPFDDWMAIGTFLIVFSKTEKRLGDIVAQTIVIQEPTRPQIVTVQLSKLSERAAQEWTDLGITSVLSVQDFAVIRDFLQRRRNFAAPIRFKVSERLFHQLRHKLGLKTVPLGFTAEEHLEGIYRAYSEVHSPRLW
ncbi:MAG: RDD family protein [Pseudanabaenaceae cyanobacterium SKYGB_i_bin29]|nr:RDD family protein [Pseudanabaenaceae cyanobacterium SKYG29]MDW8420626.1 RDD family protein [Pseudanabaenaceae cyanobacterium SKYGB_i_bin29]